MKFINKYNKKVILSYYLILVMSLITFLVSLDIPSQVTEEWATRYNGPGNDEDRAQAIATDSSGNIYITGQSYGSGTDWDYVTIKYNSAGIQQWIVRYNGPGNDEDEAKAIEVDSSGSVYVTGHSLGSGTSYDYATIKYNSAGIQQWIARYNSPGNYSDLANAIAIDDSGNVYVTGQSGGSTIYPDYATVKYNSSGVEQWAAIYNGPGNQGDYAKAIATDSSGNVYVTGYGTGSGTSSDYATIKYNGSGIQQWATRYNGPGNGWDSAAAIALDSLGNVYVTGESAGLITYYDYATIKYNNVGVEQWVARYNTPENDSDSAEAITLDNSGNVYVTGQSIGSGSGLDYATVKYNNAGVEQWDARYNGPGNYSDWANAIALDSVGNIYVTGYSEGSGTSSDYATIKYNGSGIEQWIARYNGTGNSADVASSIAIDNLRNIYITGYSTGSGTNYDCTTIKYSQSVFSEAFYLY